MRTDNGDTSDFLESISDVPVIEEPLEYSDIESNLAARNKKQRDFEEYLKSVSSDSTDSSQESADNGVGSGDGSDTGAAHPKRSPIRRKLSSVREEIRGSSLGRFLFGYDKQANALAESSVGKAVDRHEQPKGATRFFYMLDNGIISKIMQNTIYRLLSLSAKYYGIMLVAYAIVSSALYIFDFAVIDFSTTVNIFYFIYGMCAMILATFLVTSDRSLSGAFSESRVIRAVFVSFLGYRLTDTEAHTPVRTRALYAAIFSVMGALLGLFTVFVSAHIVWLVVLVFIFLLLSFSSPEFCFNFTVLILPFTVFFARKTLPIAVLTGLCGLCYLRKLMLRKRSFAFEPIDFYVLMFAIIYFLSGITSIGGEPAFGESIILLVLLCGYFLAANLLKSERNLVSICKVISLSAFIVSAVGIVEFFTGRAEVRWLDTAIFGTENGRIVSLFSNSNVLAMYLIFTLPFVIGEINKSVRPIALIPRLFNLVAVIAAIGLTQSRAGYLALIFSVLAMLFFKRRRGMRRIIVAFAIVPYIILLLPSFILTRFDSIFSSAFDTSVSYRIQIWQGAIRMISDYLFIGIGGGSSSFASVYPDYATAGAESAIHLHNIFLQCFVETGIFGITVFILLLFVFVQMNTSKLPDLKLASIRYARYASFISVMALIVFGATDYIWYDRRLFFLFFVAIGICTAARRFTKEQSITADAEHNAQSKQLKVDSSI